MHIIRGPAIDANSIIGRQCRNYRLLSRADVSRFLDDRALRGWGAYINAARRGKRRQSQGGEGNAFSHGFWVRFCRAILAVALRDARVFSSHRNRARPSRPAAAGGVHAGQTFGDEALIFALVVFAMMMRRRAPHPGIRRGECARTFAFESTFGKVLAIAIRGLGCGDAYRRAHAPFQRA
jgi:hypothetical protein